MIDSPTADADGVRHVKRAERERLDVTKTHHAVGVDLKGLSVFIWKGSRRG